MVNGEMQCLGGAPYLKNKFAQGFTLSLRLKQEALSDPEDVQALTSEILRRYDLCIIRDQHQISIQFRINTAQMEWDQLFEILESIKTQFDSSIEEYSIEQTTLEEVFLSFARQQIGQRCAESDCCSCSCSSKPEPVGVLNMHAIQQTN